MMKKYSRQRELIYSSLKQRMDHPSVEALYSDLKKQMPEIGIATIYRNLSELCQEEKAIKIKSKIGPDRFDGNIMPHIHFQCEKCQSLMDVFLEKKEMQNIDNDMTAIAEKIGCKAVSNEITITGVCEACNKNHKKSS